MDVICSLICTYSEVCSWHQICNTQELYVIIGALLEVVIIHRYIYAIMGLAMNIHGGW